MMKQIVVSTVLSAALASAAVATASELDEEIIGVNMVAELVNTSQSDCDVSADAVLANFTDLLASNEPIWGYLIDSIYNHQCTQNIEISAAGYASTNMGLSAEVLTQYW